MPKLSTAITTTTTEEVKLAPALKVKLRKRLQTYAALHAEKKAIIEKMDKEKALIGELRDEAEVLSLDFEGFKVTYVQGTSSKLDKKKFVALGGPLKMLENATVTTPKKAYELVTVPGEKGDD
jgi:hypothetical protein